MTPKAAFSLLGFVSGLFIYATAGLAVVFTDYIMFSPGTEAADITSGNHVDFTYQHHLPEPFGSGMKITGASLALSHQNNANEGPTRELWSIMGPENYFFGLLGESEKNPKTDFFDLKPFLNKWAASESAGGLEIQLSELTSFNGEKLALLDSLLEIQYETAPDTRIPTVIPEPRVTTLILLGGAFILLSCRKTNPVNAAGQKFGARKETD